MRHTTRKTQQGLSLIELMVAVVLGLLLINGALEMLLTSRGTYRNTDDLSRIQENGRFALDMLSTNIRMAGYKNPVNINFDIEDTQIFQSFFSDACDTFDPCTADGGGSNSDRIAVYLDPPPDAGSDTDCVGNPVGDEDNIANVYFLETVNGISTLFCRGFNNSTGSWTAGGRQPLLDGIDNMQILYGLEDATGQVDRYVSADELSGADWGNIGAVRLALLVSSGTDRTDAYAQPEFNLLDADTISPANALSRRVFTTTIILNNRKGLPEDV